MKRRVVVMSLLVAALGLTCLRLPSVESQTPPRIAAFSLNCVGSHTGPVHTRARLVGLLRLMNRSTPLRFTASCQDGPSSATFPTLTPQDGEVIQVNLIVDVDRLDAAGKVLATNQCTGTTLNGFVKFSCLADEGGLNQADVLASVAK
jgi:hypothetical protein